jgi:hypothetical protein
MTFLQQTMQKLSARQERLRRSAKLPASRSGRDYARSIRKAQKALRLARYLMLQTFAVVSRDTVLGARWHFSQTMQGRKSSNIKKARSLAGLEASSVRRWRHLPCLLLEHSSQVFRVLRLSPRQNNRPLAAASALWPITLLARAYSFPTQPRPANTECSLRPASVHIGLPAGLSR